MFAEAGVILRASNITKEFGATVALSSVNFEIFDGKVSALFGENGAGKSTLMKILSGIEAPTSGTLEVNGEEVVFESVNEARAKGIAIIHQELNLAPNLNVRDNIFLGQEIRSHLGGIDYSKENEITAELMGRLEEPISPMALVGDLRLGQQQIVEIARALAANARILIMDEPTSALSSTEIEVLFKVIDDLKAHGVSIVYISHHLEEALHVADTVTVLRDSKLIATDERKNVDLNWIVNKMIGHDSTESSASLNELGDVVLEIRNLNIVDPSNPARLSVEDLSLEVRQGEIVCLYGQMGAGRTELLETLAGRIKPLSGQILLNGRDIAALSIRDRINGGLALVPEDRQRDGLIRLLSVGENLALSNLSNYVKRFVLRDKAEITDLKAAISDVRVKTSSHKALITSLSGGNQQKVVIGKVLLTKPKIIVLDEPTRGIDVGAKAEIFSLLSILASSGLAVLFATSEVSEAMTASNRIVVMSKGSISAQLDPQKTSRSDVISAADEKSTIRSKKLDLNGVSA